MRVLFLTDSLDEKTPRADDLVRLVATLNAAGGECALISFLPCGKARKKRIAECGVPVRYMQAFNSRIRFYAPGLTNAVLYFRPDAVVLAAPAAHLHAGPLSRAFRGLRLVSFLPGGNAGALCRLARKRCAAIVDEAFPPPDADEARKAAFLEKIAAAVSGVPAKTEGEAPQDST